MCFSPEADLVGGTVIAAIGVDAMRHVSGRATHRALAALPLLLGCHQLVESVVWFGLQGHLPGGLGRFAVSVYLAIAFVVLPIYVPIAVLAIEPSLRRRWLTAPFVALGIIVGSAMAVAMIRTPYGASLASYHVAYHIGIHDSIWLVGAYIVAVCGALLVSGERYVVLFGAVNLIAVAVIAKLTVDGFASVWCGWAALSSGAIALYIRWTRTRGSNESEAIVRQSAGDLASSS